MAEHRARARARARARVRASARTTQMQTYKPADLAASIAAAARRDTSSCLAADILSLQHTPAFETDPVLTHPLHPSDHSPHPQTHLDKPQHGCNAAALAQARAHACTDINRNSPREAATAARASCSALASASACAVSAAASARSLAASFLRVSCVSLGSNFPWSLGLFALAICCLTNFPCCRLL